MVLAPEHPLVEKITTEDCREKVEEYVRKARAATEVERMAEEKDKTGEFTGAFAINPVNDKKIPVWISDYVLMSYGTGAIMAVPAHDTRDWEFATRFKLPIIQVVLPQDGNKDLKEAYTDEGIMMNSDDFDGLASRDGFEKIVDRLAEKNLARRQVNYRLRDWLISRQRYWGAPIPMVYCDKCGVVPVPAEDLPVLLPHVDHYQPTGTGESPLAAIPEFVHTKCPSCGADAKRDTDTISQWVCSSWYFLRYASPHDEDAPFDEEKVKIWLPVDLYVGGVEHAILHLLYSRFFTKVLFDADLIDFKEPFTRLFNQGMICRKGEVSGKLEKMSKSKGNVVNPDQLVENYGTDSLRAYELFIGPPDQDSEWDDSGIEGVYRWMKRVFHFVTENKFRDGQETSREINRHIHSAIQKITEDIERFHMNTIVSSLMECFNNILEHNRNHPGRIYRESIETYIRLMAPVAPHIAEELWRYLENESSVFETRWPDYNPDFIKSDTMVVMVQVNGKVREKLEIPIETDRNRVERMALDSGKVQYAIGDKKVQKVIYVPGRILSIVAK